VDSITGLSPVISIEQKTTSRNPRSTVGTITEIYDLLRLLYARIGEAFSYVPARRWCATPTSRSWNCAGLTSRRDIVLLAPLVTGPQRPLPRAVRAGARQGFLRARVDGDIKDITANMKVDRYKVHDIEVVVDRLQVNAKEKRRLAASLQTAMKHGKGMLMVFRESDKKTHHYSRHLMCPSTGLAYADPEPNTFSFNSPYGACPHCSGLGTVSEMDLDKIIPNRKLSIRKGGLAPIANSKNGWIFRQLEAIGMKHGFSLDTPLAELDEEAINTILYGSDEVFRVKNESLGVTDTYSLNFEGIVNFISNQFEESPSGAIKRWASGFMQQKPCPECEGQRLKKESLHFLIEGRSIAGLANMDLHGLRHEMDTLAARLDERRRRIANEILRELSTRLGFLLDVGLDYLA
jgi:excinuclease ABC subunit A